MIPSCLFSLFCCLCQWFNAAPEYIFDIPGSQMEAQMGPVSENCGIDPDVWTFNNGILSLTYNGIWDGNTFDANGNADLTGVNTCGGFDLLRNGEASLSWPYSCRE
jgi:hypothetical protein